MHYHTDTRIELNSNQLATLAKQFESLTTVEGLARLLGLTEATLRKLAQKQEYITFHIPKPGGQKRLINHPVTNLKVVQQNLNRYLQAVYYGVKPACAYGFISIPTDEIQPRNIYSNALSHHKSEWFLNLDLKDFFHTVTTTHLKDLFRQVFNFPADLSSLLTDLCSYQKRLPMGAPTSPALSNLCCLFFDFQLEQLAAEHQAIFTRYADDLTFSFRAAPPLEFMDQVRIIILRHGFVVNENKLRLQNRLEQPEITGLVMGKGTKPTLSKNWLKRLRQEIKMYRWLMSEAVRERGLFHAFVFDRFRRSVQGQVAFVGFVLGKDHHEYKKLSLKVA
jgi:RNA-directed DNA polymerase